MQPSSTHYYAVIFSSKRSDVGEADYAAMSKDMLQLAAQQTGFLGLESARQDIGITVSYWQSLEAIAAWKAQAKHQMAQRLGQQHWYQHYHIRICQVVHEYAFSAPESSISNIEL